MIQTSLATWTGLKFKPSGRVGHIRTGDFYHLPLTKNYFTETFQFPSKKNSICTASFNGSVTSSACRKNSNDVITQKSNYTTEYVATHSEQGITEAKTANKKMAVQELVQK